MSAVSLFEKRASERLQASGLFLQVSLNGHRIKTPVTVLEYNRNGIAFVSSVYLDCSQKIRLSIELENNHVGPIEAAVHNCRKIKTGAFRCGVQFRTDAPNQLDRHKIMLDLILLEDTLRLVQGSSD